MELLDSEVRWSDRLILKSIRNPSGYPYTIKMSTEEVTFIGVPKQPDFAKVVIEFLPNERVIELKSLKEYFADFRNRVLSYERFINVVFVDLMKVYDPKYVKIVVLCNPRGGISSELTIESQRKD